MGDHADQPLLLVEGLSLAFPRRDGRRRGLTPVLQDVSFDVGRSESVALVGESGSGKTLTALSILGLQPRTARITQGRIRLDGDDLLGLDDHAMTAYRGKRASMIFQSPKSSLNPLLRVGRQVARAVALHRDVTRSEARGLAIDLLDAVGIHDPARRYDAYPHQLSGGMAQRAMIAIALAGNPELLIADEPTTSLDVTIQAQILDLLSDLQQRFRMSLLLITHDLGVVREVCHRVVVLQDGQVVEQALTQELFERPNHPYSAKLVASVPALSRGQPGTGSAPPVQVAAPEPFLRVRDLHKRFHAHGEDVIAVDGVSFEVAPGETVALVGESGCGKTTTGRCVLGLEHPERGEILIDGEDVTAYSPRQWRRARRAVQIVFQDAQTSLNPSMSVRATLREPLKLHGIVPTASGLEERLRGLMELVHLRPALLDRYPDQLSGGQRQRVCIARALATEPRFVVLDEPTSALDMSIRAALIDLLAELQGRLGLSYLFITHDFGSVERIADRVIVMYRGRIMEEGPAADVLADPRHPYTQLLISSIPGSEAAPAPTPADGADEPEARLPGTGEDRDGCLFQDRCALVMPVCRSGAVPERRLGATTAACHAVGDPSPADPAPFEPQEHRR